MHRTPICPLLAARGVAAPPDPSEDKIKVRECKCYCKKDEERIVAVNLIPRFIVQMSDSMYRIVQKTANRQGRQICTDAYPRSALRFRGRDGNFSWEPTIKYPVARQEHTRARTHAQQPTGQADGKVY